MLDKSNPLWLPAGSVRSIIALIIVATTMGLYVATNAAPDGLVAIAGAVIGWYFAKSTADKPEPPTSVTKG